MQEIGWGCENAAVFLRSRAKDIARIGGKRWRHSYTGMMNIQAEGLEKLAALARTLGDSL